MENEVKVSKPRRDKKALAKKVGKWVGITLFVAAFILLLALQVRTMTLNKLMQTYNAGYQKAVVDVGQTIKANIKDKGEMKLDFGKDGGVMTLIEKK